MRYRITYINIYISKKKTRITEPEHTEIMLHKTNIQEKGENGDTSTQQTWKHEIA
jgi:hypothetical protein